MEQPQKVEYYVWDCKDLEDAVKEVLGQQFEFEADQEITYEFTQEFTVTGELSEWQQEVLDRFLETGAARFVTGALLNHLAAEGVIPKGNYLIKN